jgi:hypothetical protein
VKRNLVQDIPNSVMMDEKLVEKFMKERDKTESDMEKANSSVGNAHTMMVGRMKYGLGMWAFGN